MDINQQKTHISDELRRAIDAQASRIDVEPYYTMAMNKGLKGHAMGFWSGTGMGLLTGAAAGVILHITAGAALAAAGIAGAPVIAGLAGIGATVGGHIGSRVGSAAGAVSGVMAEFERRLRAQQLEQEVLASPEKQQEVLNNYRAYPVVERDDTIGEINRSNPTAQSVLGKIILPSTMLLTVALCATAGAIMAAGAFLLGGAAGVGFGATTLASAISVGVGLGAATGVSFGIYYPGIFAQGAKATGELLSGATAEKLFNSPPRKREPDLALEEKTELAVSHPATAPRAQAGLPALQVQTSSSQHERMQDTQAQRTLH